MSTSYDIGNEGTVEQGSEQETVEVIDEVAERESMLRPGVEAEIQATVDYADDRLYDGRLFGQTLEAEERMRAREWEVERTRVRWDRRADSDREVRTRTAIGLAGRETRYEFLERATSVNPWLDPSREDPREELSQVELGVVNQAATRIVERLDGWTRAAVSRRLAECVVDGQEVTDATLTLFEELQVAPGHVIPIDAVGTVDRREVSIQGMITQLWEPSCAAIQQVGLIEDDTGRTKFTIWRKSKQPIVREGEDVRFYDVAKSWYRGRVSVALTSRSRVTRLE